MATFSWYNGFSPAERGAKLRALQAHQKAGLLNASSGACDLCGDPEAQTEYHSEDYSFPYGWSKPAMYSVCRYCHRNQLHGRFSNPTSWLTFLAHVRRGGYARDLQNPAIRHELREFKSVKAKRTEILKLEILRPYQNEVGKEWFANLSMTNNVLLIRDGDAFSALQK